MQPVGARDPLNQYINNHASEIAFSFSFLFDISITLKVLICQKRSYLTNYY